MIQTKYLAIFAIVAVLFNYTDGNCIFPDELKGSWKHPEGDDTLLQFTSDELTGFKLTVPRLSQSDFECISFRVDGDSTKYMLRARNSVTVFGDETSTLYVLKLKTFYVMFVFHRHNYAELLIATKLNHALYNYLKDPILQDKLYGTAVNTIPDISDVCNLGDQEGIVILKESGNGPKQTKRKITSLLSQLRQALEQKDDNFDIKK
ncbi:unnamed protein product [Mytilus edulis]|uniref:Lipocalin/cytosolic fatty-acid binding domain-containing protein n=1 Tax=Mytilus edulis TaxID=6550 RepID=A0A8S3QF32_MYTED|nr:unnamed protein product [Mytilus edulis]